jgi:DNA-binding NtrC family response regulator
VNTAFVLLYSTDTALAKMVRVAVSNTSACRFDRVSDKTAANQRLYAGGVELVLLHLADSTQEPNVVRLLREASALGVPAVLIVDQHDPALLIRLLRHGAADCLERPLNISRLELLIDILTMRSRHAPVEEPASQPGDEPEDDDLAPFLVVSSKMRSVVQQIRKVTHLDGTILLTGETGTGKSCLARVIHRLSARSARPFLDINCGAISPTLVESEMFGHVRGAFTGADCNHEGKLA